MKTCPCCRRVYQTIEDWERLPDVGVIDDGVEILSLRNCPCDSTIAITLALYLCAKEEL